ncbi:probable cytochrome P450 6a14 [Homalodisca vitripennis]|uniref:probable cytochrome P450 6a14 n=1 Tax=Homalodisca vitripennis TaxID=197043 RepID=UPI001EEBACB6|nr:probable cytochrome P450 6a14 [Homalodisca vitripennis]
MATNAAWFLGYFLLAVFSLLSLLYLYVASAFKYFEKRRIPYEPATFAIGNLWPVLSMKKSYNDFVFDLYKKHRTKKLVGIFQFFRKSVLIIDRELLRSVLVRDFQYFDGKSLHYNKELEPLTAHLFSLGGQQWKVLRAKITPLFSSNKTKGMFPIFIDAAHKLSEYVSQITEKNDEIECKDLFTRFSVDVTTSTAFGLDIDVASDKAATFKEMAGSIFSPSLGSMYRNSLWFYGGFIAKTFNLRIIPKKTHDFFFNLAKDTVEYRETNGNNRNDLLQPLIELKQGAKSGDEGINMTIEELAAQAYMFVLAGYETTSTALNFFLYEMAMNPEVQERIHAEVDAVEEITYDTLAGMEYLDMALDELHRKHAQLGFLSRTCTKDYQVPGTDYVIERGTEVLVSVQGLHKDPELFPEPERFIPERFSKENKGKIKPFSYMPYGEGPRYCAGQRFAQLMVKTGLAVMMKRFSVQTSPRTPNPMRYDPLAITLAAAGGMWLRLVDRQRV